MEFFEAVANRAVTAEELQDLITIARLPELCSSIDSVLSIESPERGEIYCVWGQFRIARERIRNGVRIALLNCPHALAWTVAAHARKKTVIIHCTIDDREEEEEFVETIEQFLRYWAEGLARLS